MILGILIGIGSMLVVSGLVSLFDPDGREVLARAAVTLLLLPAIPVYHLMRKALSGDFQARRLNNAALRRFVHTGAYSAAVVHRKGRAHIVLIDPKARKKGRKA